MPGLLDRGEVDRGSFVSERGTKDDGVTEGGRARAGLRPQTGGLALELSGLVAEGLGRVRVPHRVGAAGPPRVLGLGELEDVRDALATRVADARRALAERAALE